MGALRDHRARPLRAFTIMQYAGTSDHSRGPLILSPVPKRPPFGTSERRDDGTMMMHCVGVLTQKGVIIACCCSHLSSRCSDTSDHCLLAVLSRQKHPPRRSSHVCQLARHLPTTSPLRPSHPFMVCPTKLVSTTLHYSSRSPLPSRVARILQP